MVVANVVLRNMKVSTSKELYKYLLRECQKLPKDAHEFYKHNIKQVRFLSQRIFMLQKLIKVYNRLSELCCLYFQSFKQHMLESDPVRVKQIIDRAVEDASWVVKKVCDT
jgi:hypothetical protein